VNIASKHRYSAEVLSLNCRLARFYQLTPPFLTVVFRPIGAPVQLLTELRGAAARPSKVKFSTGDGLRFGTIL
jgi:hypothetical protein